MLVLLATTQFKTSGIISKKNSLETKEITETLSHQTLYDILALRKHCLTFCRLTTVMREK